MITVPEPTFEGLSKLYAVGRASLGLFATEGGQFVGGHGMSEDHRLKTSAGLSALWDGELLRRVRAGDGASILPGRRLAAHLMLQPGVAAALLGDRRLDDQGLLSRLLIVAPDTAAGSRFWREPSATAARDLDSYDARILSILREPMPLSDSDAGGLAPRVLRLQPDARRTWIAFADHVEGQLARDGDLAPIRAFASKLAEHAARIAAVLALTDDLDATHLDRPHLDAGIAIAEHHASEWLRLHEAAADRPEIERAERLARWLCDVWPGDVIGLPECYQRGPHAIRDARSAREAMALLEEHGQVIRLEAGAEIDGIRRRDAWRIVGKEIES